MQIKKRHNILNCKSKCVKGSRKKVTFKNNNHIDYYVLNNVVLNKSKTSSQKVKEQLRFFRHGRSSLFVINKNRLTYFFNANYMYFVKNSKVVLVLRLIDVFNILLLNPFNQRAWDSIISYGNDNAVVKSINPTVAPPKVGAGEIKALVPVVTAGDSEGSNNDIPPGSDVTTTNGEGLFDKLNYDALRTCAKIIGTVLVTGGTLYVGYKIYTEGFNFGTLHSILRGIGIWGNLPERRRVPEFTESSPIDPNNIGGQNPEVPQTSNNSVEIKNKGEKIRQIFNVDIKHTRFEDVPKDVSKEDVIIKNEKTNKTVTANIDNTRNREQREQREEEFKPYVDTYYMIHRSFGSTDENIFNQYLIEMTVVSKQLILSVDPINPISIFLGAHLNAITKRDSKPLTRQELNCIEQDPDLLYIYKVNTGKDSPIVWRHYIRATRMLVKLQFMHNSYMHNYDKFFKTLNNNELKVVPSNWETVTGMIKYQDATGRQCGNARYHQFLVHFGALKEPLMRKYYMASFGTIYVSDAFCIESKSLDLGCLQFFNTIELLKKSISDFNEGDYTLGLLNVGLNIFFLANFNIFNNADKRSYNLTSLYKDYILQIEKHYNAKFSKDLCIKLYETVLNPIRYFYNDDLHQVIYAYGFIYHVNLLILNGTVNVIQI